MPSAAPAATLPRSSHTSDALLTPFLGPTFDPTAYLNSTLPPLAIATPTQPILPAKSLSVTDLASRTQSHVAALNAQSARLTATLSSLTDEILRGGSRLAYAVELLRGEAAGLSEVLAESLQEEIGAFVPGGEVKRLLEGEGKGEKSIEQEEREEQEEDEDGDEESTALPKRLKQQQQQQQQQQIQQEPASLARLRTLHLVRARLQSVIHTFDQALGWPLAPAPALSSSSIVSITDPTTSSSTSTSQQQQAAQQALEAQNQLRNSVMDLLEGRGAKGVLEAEARVAELRDLVKVWKGTQEEKTRTKFVDGLARVVAERRREEEGRGALRAEHGGEVTAAPAVQAEGKEGNNKKATANSSSSSSSGFFGGLRRLGTEIYLD